MKMKTPTAKGIRMKSSTTTQAPKPKMLLIFDQSPEELSFYLLDRNSEQAKLSREVADKYVNGDNMTRKQYRIFDKLSEWMATPEGKAAKQPKGIIKHRITEVVRIGFIL